MCGRNQVGLTTALKYIKIVAGQLCPSEVQEKEGGIDHKDYKTMNFKNADFSFLSITKMAIKYTKCQ
jgi:hypothetical protein